MMCKGECLEKIRINAYYRTDPTHTCSLHACTNYELCGIATPEYCLEECNDGTRVCSKCWGCLGAEINSVRTASHSSRCMKCSTIERVFIVPECGCRVCGVCFRRTLLRMFNKPSLPIVFGDESLSKEVVSTPYWFRQKFEYPYCPVCRHVSSWLTDPLKHLGLRELDE